MIFGGKGPEGVAFLVGKPRVPPKRGKVSRFLRDSSEGGPGFLLKNLVPFGRVKFFQNKANFLFGCLPNRAEQREGEGLFPRSQGATEFLAV